ARVLQFHRGERGDVFPVKILLREIQRHEDAAILETVLRLQDSADFKLTFPDLHFPAHGSLHKFSSACPEKDPLWLLRKTRAISDEAVCLGDAGITLLHSKASNDRMIR